MNTKYSECDCCMKGYYEPNEFGLCHCSCSECCKSMSICLYNCKYYKKIIKKQLKKIYTIVMSELLQYGKTTIKIPEKMMLLKNGKETLQDVITKTGNLTTRNKEKSLKFETTKSNTISIKTVPVEIKPIPEIKKKELDRLNNNAKDKKDYEDDIKEIKEELKGKEDKGKREYKVNWRTMQYYIKTKNINAFLNDKNIPNIDKSHFLQNKYEITDKKFKEELVTEMYKKMANPEENKIINPTVKDSSKLKINKINFFGEN